MELTDASAVVTGGASGLGAATARALAARGAFVVVADVDRAKGEAVAAEIGGAFQPTDVTSASDGEAAVDRALAERPMRVLVNCAGIGPAQRTIGRDGSYESAHSLDGFRRVIEINLIGTFNMLRLGASAISRSAPGEDGARGVVVNTASVAAFDGQIGQAAYSASKGGIVGMTLPIARDLAVAGIRVVTVAPGLVDTPIYGEGEAAEEMKAALGKQVVFPQRLGRADEFAQMVMAAVDNTYLNGETIRLDGAIRMAPR
jgi:NAD(P)-dependent dehydrogenase (short-subunit alcohol dehydrogenase family)